MSDVIRKAVELADGFDLTENQLTFPSGHYFTVTSDDTILLWMRAAIAEQLVRQVDAITDTFVCLDVEVELGITTLWKHDEAGYPEELRLVTGPDRTMNTINAIIDSRCLRISDRPAYPESAAD